MSNVPSSAERMANLYKGYNDAHGRLKGKNHSTLRKPLTLDLFEAHLRGTIGLGVIPVNKEGLSWFGAIDIDRDADKGDVPIDHQALARKAGELGIPILICRSKSGTGAHLYTFMQEPMKARDLRKRLSSWAAKLGFGESEIFPKQDKIQDVGNWINLPYFGGTERLAVSPTGELSLEEFLIRAEAIAESESVFVVAPQSLEGLAPWLVPLIGGAPPCLRQYLMEGVGEGARNEILFDIGIYLKKCSRNEWEEILYRVNYTLTSPPLPNDELKRITGSLARKEYSYRCNSDTCRHNCDRLECETLPFGVGSQDEDYGELVVGGLVKILTNPPRWQLDINGHRITFSTEELMNYAAVRTACLERADIVAPPMKGERWLKILKDRLAEKVDVEAPEDATQHGPMVQGLHEFLLLSHRASSRSDLDRGLPVQDSLDLTVDGVVKPVKVVFFRSADFLSFLKRRRISVTMPNHQLWITLRELGCGHTRTRVGTAVRNVWYMPEESIEPEPEIEPKRREDSL